MNGVNQAQYEKIKTVKADLQRYKDFKADLQKRVDKMEKDKKAFKAKIEEQKLEKKKSHELIENFKAIQEQMINQHKPADEKITVSTETLIAALEKAKKLNERQKFKTKLAKGESKEQNAQVNKYLQGKLEDVQFKQQVMEETLKSVKLIVDPKAKA
tara:strand:+ start:498 stop:968 length:471 start_codon:yes stop_codon:yes gene_type:complete